jgi:hypothetical protein
MMRYCLFGIFDVDVASYRHILRMSFFSQEKSEITFSVQFGTVFCTALR